jgi:thioredoxin
MKTIYRFMTVAAAAMLMMVACGNAATKNQDKKKEVKEVVKTTAVKELTDADFNKLVYDVTAPGLKYLGDKPAIVDFTAKWCGPCQRISPILDELSKEYEGEIVIYKVDIDKCQQLAQAFGVSSIPAILYIPLDGDPSMTVGSRDKTRFKNEIDSILLGK